LLIIAAIYHACAVLLHDEMHGFVPILISDTYSWFLSKTIAKRFN